MVKKKIKDGPHTLWNTVIKKWNSAYYNAMDAMGPLYLAK